MTKKWLLFPVFIIVLLVGCQNDASELSDPHPNQTHNEDSQFASPNNPVLSPSGLYILEVHEDYSDSTYNNSFTIYPSDDSSQPLFISDKKYRTRDRLYFCWDSYDNIWVYSGDTGTDFWRVNAYDNVWIESIPLDELPPDILNDII